LECQEHPLFIHGLPDQPIHVHLFLEHRDEFRVSDAVVFPITGFYQIHRFLRSTDQFGGRDLATFQHRASDAGADPDLQIAKHEGHCQMTLDSMKQLFQGIFIGDAVNQDHEFVTA
jgi:hypothetical protein